MTDSKGIIKVSRLFQDLEGVKPEEKIDLLMACLAKEEKQILLERITEKQ